MLQETLSNIAQNCPSQNIKKSSKSGSQSSTRYVPKSCNPVARPKHGMPRWRTCPSQHGLTTRAVLRPFPQARRVAWHGHFFVRPDKGLCVRVRLRVESNSHVYIYTHIYTYLYYTTKVVQARTSEPSHKSLLC